MKDSLMRVRIRTLSRLKVVLHTRRPFDGTLRNIVKYEKNKVTVKVRPLSTNMKNCKSGQPLNHQAI